MKPVCAALLLFVSSAAAAQTTFYRCGADGRELSQKPCPEGQAVTVRPQPPSGEPEQTRERVEREQLVADELEKERKARDAADLRRNAYPVGIKRKPPPPEAKPTKSQKKPRPKRPR